MTNYEKDDPLLTVHNNINFFGKPGKPSNIFVMIPLEIVLKDIIKNLRISGNPCIGKSFFGYFLINRLVKNNKTIVYDAVQTTVLNKVVLLGQTIEEVRFLENNSYNFATYIGVPKVWYIADGEKPQLSEAKTWRGIPRYVLEGAYDTIIQEQLDNAVAACDINILVIYRRKLY
ncbi:crinkler (CRN) family protein, putative [Rhizophagus clarus]|uniref:Crinkler (CRN) family protein, putative n=1 Tax=Rhizophagus clarus TaxID=94130 RepID=A0A8H3LWD9_9GLOM|nr:crinkler (CRN) family protein, putative [Rhizophagus clarus]